MPDPEADALYRVVDADGEPLWDSIYEDEKEALSRRAREMSEHPDGDAVTVVKYEAVDGGWGSGYGDGGYGG